MSDMNQFKTELESVIHRYAQESDLSVGEVIGTLEALKIEILMGNMDEEPPTNLEDEANA